MIIGRIVGVTGALMGFAPMLAATATMLLGFDVAAAPITLTIAALGGLAAAGWFVYANWNKFGGWWKSLWGAVPQWAKIGLDLFTSFAGPFFAIPAFIMKNWQPLKAFFANLWASFPAPPT